MTEKEAKELLSLCRDFSALDQEHRKFALDVSKNLLSAQVPGSVVQGKRRRLTGAYKGGKTGVQ